jgi:hypothetical protein
MDQGFIEAGVQSPLVNGILESAHNNNNLYRIYVVFGLTFRFRQSKSWIYESTFSKR